MEMRTVNLEPGSTFEANGKNYKVLESFPIGRYSIIEEAEEEALMFGNKKRGHEVMLAAMKKINEYNPGEAYTLLYNKIDIDQRSVKTAPYLLKICACYIVQEGEDLKYLSDDLIKEKIHDWSEAALDIRPFLVLSLRASKELIESYRKPIQDILNHPKTVAEAMMEEDQNIKISREGNGEEKQ